jgi:hypothetical protein
MNRFFNIKPFFLILLILFGCDEERILFDGTTLVHFPASTQRVLLDWNDQGQISIPVGVVTTQPLSSAGTFRLSVDTETSTALVGKHVAVPADFSFPANSYTGSFNVMVSMQDMINEFEEAGGGTLQLRLLLEGENIALFNNSITVSLTLPYPISVQYMIGRWAVTDEGFGSEAAPVTDSYFIDVFENPADDNSVIVEGLWEIPGIPLVMHLDLETWQVMIESQPYGCYNAGLSEPACVTIYSHEYLFGDSDDPNITGIITPEGEIRLNSGYVMLIENHPTHSGFFFIPRVHTSSWVKLPDQKANNPDETRERRLFHFEK